MFNKIIDKIITKLERRVSVSEIVKADDLVLSNASLKDIKRAINNIHTEVNNFNKIK